MGFLDTILSDNLIYIYMYTYIYIYIYIYISERDVVEVPFLRCFKQVTKKHLWSLYHQMFIVLIMPGIF